MNNECKWKIIFPCIKDHFALLSRSHVHVRYDPALYSRTSDPSIDEVIKLSSLKNINTKSNNSQIFANPKYRFAGLECKYDRIVLNIGITNYIDYINFRSAKDIINNIPQPSDLVDYLPNVIGNVGILLTKDRRTFGVVRSNKVSTYRGYLDFPGGHPELAEAKVTKQVYCENDYGTLIRDELFDSVIREIVEDLGIDSIVLDDPLLFAILLNIEDVLKPDMAFIITTNQTKEEIINCFLKHNPKPYEVKEIVSFDPMNYETHLSNYNMTPIMEGCLSLLKNNGYDRLIKGGCNVDRR